MSSTGRRFRCLIVAAVLGTSIITALNFITMHTFAQNATSVKTTTAGGGNKTEGIPSLSSCSTGSTASSCYDLGYQNALANPGKTCPSRHSNNHCAGWAHANEKR